MQLNSEQEININFLTKKFMLSDFAKEMLALKDLRALALIKIKMTPF
jgi:hypothetical protein